MVDTDKLFHLSDEQGPISAGQLLVAKPTIDDPIFGRSVVLLIEHNASGSFGLMLNNYQGWSLNRNLTAITDEQGIPVFCGGPVGLDQLFFIHTLGTDVISGAMRVTDGLYVGGDLDEMLHYLHSTEQEDELEKSIKFCLGYSGWSAGQLQGEVDRHDWAIVNQMPLETILAYQCDKIWPAAVAQLGDRYRLWNNWPKDLSSN